MSDTDAYVMGRSAHETNRLQRQAELYGPHTEHLLTLAGVAPGMRVLDVGCGAGDVTMQVARLVGPTGSVIGVDVDPDVLAVARLRAAEEGLVNVSFQRATLPDVPLAEPVDALVGRLIVMHLDDPAATVRALSGLVRSGGVVSFQDFNATLCRTVPAQPLFNQVRDWLLDALRAGGRNPNAGDDLFAVLRDAGLAVAGVAAETPGGFAESGIHDYLATTLTSVVPLITAHGIATLAELDLDTIADRLVQEGKESGAVVFPPELVAAWARVP